MSEAAMIAVSKELQAIAKELDQRIADVAGRTWDEMPEVRHG